DLGERVRHTLERRLASRGRQKLCCGTRFVTGQCLLPCARANLLLPGATAVWRAAQGGGVGLPREPSRASAHQQGKPDEQGRTSPRTATASRMRRGSLLCVGCTSVRLRLRRRSVVI